MGTTNYYTATLPFGAVTKLFTFDPDKMMELTVEERSPAATEEQEGSRDRQLHPGPRGLHLLSHHRLG